MKIVKKDQERELEDHFNASELPTFLKLETFPRFVSQQTLMHFICRYEVFKRVLRVNGSIVDLGVFNGKSLFTWIQLCSIFEPQNFTRRIIAFDTFEGFPALHDADMTARDRGPSPGDYQTIGSLEHLEQGIRRLDRNFSRSDQYGKVELIKGDINETVPKYIEQNPHLVVSLLHLDVDLYEPTRAALSHFLPRMPKGAVLAFDELNAPGFPGETMALLEEIGIRKVRLRRFPFGTYVSYAVLD